MIQLLGSILVPTELFSWLFLYIMIFPELFPHWMVKNGKKKKKKNHNWVIYRFKNGIKLLGSTQQHFSHISLTRIVTYSRVWTNCLVRGLSLPPLTQSHEDMKIGSWGCHGTLPLLKDMVTFQVQWVRNKETATSNSLFPVLFTSISMNITC